MAWSRAALQRPTAATAQHKHATLHVKDSHPIIAQGQTDAFDTKFLGLENHTKTCESGRARCANSGNTDPRGQTLPPSKTRAADLRHGWHAAAKAAQCVCLAMTCARAATPLLQGTRNSVCIASGGMLRPIVMPEHWMLRKVGACFWVRAIPCTGPGAHIIEP